MANFDQYVHSIKDDKVFGFLSVSIFLYLSCIGGCDPRC